MLDNANKNEVLTEMILSGLYKDKIEYQINITKKNYLTRYLNSDLGINVAGYSIDDMNILYIQEDFKEPKILFLNRNTMLKDTFYSLVKNLKKSLDQQQLFEMQVSEDCHFVFENTSDEEDDYNEEQLNGRSR